MIKSRWTQTTIEKSTVPALPLRPVKSCKQRNVCSSEQTFLGHECTHKTSRSVLYLTPLSDPNISPRSIIESTHVPHLNLWDELSHLELPDLLHVVHLNFLHHAVNVLRGIVKSDGCVASFSQMGEGVSSCASTREGEGGMVISSRNLSLRRSACSNWFSSRPPTLLHGNLELPAALQDSRRGHKRTFMTGFFWNTSTMRSTALSMIFTSTGRWISGASRNLTTMR